MKALVIIAKNGFQDHEYSGTVEEVKAAQFLITIASTEKGICTGKFGAEINANLSLEDVAVDSFDVIAFIGGPGARELMDNAQCHRIARESVASGKILGAICIAPTILAYAGVLKGKRATVWNEDGESYQILESHGATFTGEEVTVDGTIITGNGPNAAHAFGRALADAI